MIRPDVVLFGEQLPADRIEILSRELERGFDTYFSIGTTSVFPYIMQPMIEAKLRGKTTIEINPGPSKISRFVDIKINSGAADALYSIWTGYQKKCPA